MGKNNENDKAFAPSEMAEIMSNAWKQLSIEGLRKILADDYEYTSQWVLDTMYGADTYLDYLSHKFQSMLKCGRPTVTETRYNDDSIEIDLTQSVNGETHDGMLVFDIEDGKIVKGCMCQPTFRRIGTIDHSIGFVFHSLEQ